MFNSVKNLIDKELSHFYLLSQKARCLIVSYFLQGAAYPLVSTFINAYIWRKEGEIINVAIYNLGNFIALPIVFYINGLLLKKIKITNLYFIGSMMIALGGLMVIFYSRFNPVLYLIYGFIYGVGNGFYWANRNYLTLQETQSHNRNYFIGLNFTVDTITSIIIPFITGWLIIIGGQLHLYSINQSYQVMILTALIFLFSAGLLVSKNQYQSPQITQIIVKKISKTWSAVRILTAAVGTIEGATFFLPTLLILSQLGHEEILGTITAITAIGSAMLTYLYGRKARVQDQKPMFLISVLMGVLSAVSISIFFNKFGVILFIIFNSLAMTFVWLSSDPLVMDFIDDEVRRKQSDRYALICDRELFLNLGRWLAVLIFFILWLYFPPKIVLRFTTPLVYFVEIILITLCWGRIKKGNR